MNYRFNSIFRVFAAAIVAALAVACGGGSGSPELLSVAVHPVTGATLAGPNVNPFDSGSAQKVRFSVTGAGIDGEIESIVNFADHQASLPEIPEGYGRQVTVEVCSAQCDEKVVGDIMARGRSVPLTVKLSDSPRTIDVFVSPRNSLSSPVNDANPPVPTQPVLGERIGATMTVLDDGRVLILGGARIKTGSASWTKAEDLDVVYPNAEVYNPSNGSFTAVGTMTVPRAFHQAVKVSNGTVVVLGGYTQTGGGPAALTPSVEVFDPETGIFKQVASDKGLSGGAGRALFTAGLAGTSPDVIFLAGGLSNPPQAGASWDMYIVDTGTVGHGNLVTTRYNHSMVFMSTYGRTGPENPGTNAFILFGGENQNGIVSDVEPFTVSGFEVKADSAATTKLPGGGRTMLTAVHVPQQGIVYVIGGFTDTAHTQASSRVDVFREGIKGFRDGEVLFLNTARGAHTSTLIDFNTIVVAGGLGSGGAVLPSTELIIENLECDDMVNQTGCKYVIESVGNLTPQLSPARAGHLAVFDATRRVFMAGGFSQYSVPVTTATVYNPD